MSATKATSQCVPLLQEIIRLLSVAIATQLVAVRVTCVSTGSCTAETQETHFQCSAANMTVSP